MSGLDYFIVGWFVLGWLITPLVPLGVWHRNVSLVQAGALGEIVSCVMGIVLFGMESPWAIGRILSFILFFLLLASTYVFKDVYYAP